MDWENSLVDMDNPQYWHDTVHSYSIARPPSMSYLDHILSLNQRGDNRYLPLVIADQIVGQVTPGFAAQLARWPEVFEVGDDAVHLSDALQGFDQRSAAVAQVTDQLHADGIIARRHGEPYRVGSDFSSPALMFIDRASVAYFGVRAYGQHLNGFVRDGGDIRMWLGRRSRSKPSFPGMLDQLVAGGLPYGIPLQQNLAKECWEEAAIPEALAAQALPVGVVSYCRETDAGLKADVLFNYDLELPIDFVPRANDGEMEAFLLLPLQEVAALVEHGNEFKDNCNLVVIDFLIRHGYLPPQHPDYLALCDGLHPAL